jgi:hypothetical protein
MWLHGAKIGQVCVISRSWHALRALASASSIFRPEITKLQQTVVKTAAGFGFKLEGEADHRRAISGAGWRRTMKGLPEC